MYANKQPAQELQIGVGHCLKSLPLPFQDAIFVVVSLICSACCRYTPGSAMAGSPQQQAGPSSESVAREALKFVLSPEGAFFRDFLMNEMVQSIDALSRKQVQNLNWLFCPDAADPVCLYLRHLGTGRTQVLMEVV